MSAERLTILAVATEWDSKHGGLSTFNRDLCTALAQCEGVTVFCAVPALEVDEVERARQVGVQLVAAVSVPGVTEAQALVRPLQEIAEPVHAVIGHGRISGPAALAQVSDHFPGAVYVHFLHMDPPAIERLKDHADDGPAATAKQRVDLELELGRQARLIFAVGPELQSRYSTYFHPDQRPVREFLPGLAPAGLPALPPPHPSGLLFARAEDAKLKGLPVAARAMAELAKVQRHARTRLTILGAQPGTEEKLRSELLKVAEGPFKLYIKPYSFDRAEVLREIRAASLVLMPSLEEGFGLTGLEAISEGTPVLLSSASGLAQALQQHVPNHAAHHVFDVEATPAEIARRMQELLDQPDLAFDRVEVLRDAMKERFCWRRSAEELLAALREELRAPRSPTTPSASPRPPLAERLRDSLKQASLELQTWKQTLAHTGDWLERPELARLLEHCRTAELPRKPLVLLGAPGSGKSALLSRLVCALHEHDVAVLALKADALPASIDSPIELERWLRVAAPVAQTLDAVAALQRTVLVIDQLDALADLVDLKSDRLNVLLALVSEVTRRARVPVVLSCRSFELEHDPRLRALDCEKLRLEDLALADVQTAVANHAPQVHLTPRLTELLRLPYLLDHYLSLPPERRADTAVESHQGLVRARWQQLVAEEDENVAQQVAMLIADREELWLSTELPALRALQARVQALRASGLLVQQRIRGIEHVAFAHQTLFEFARARAFLDHATLPQYVRERQGALFVRAVLWVTLPYLRAADHQLYLRQLHELWQDTSIRRHVQVLLLEFLCQLTDPQESEITLVVERLTDTRWQVAALRALTGQRRWFELLVDSCMPGVMAGPAGELAIGVLLRATDFAPQQVAALMERVWWPEHREWIERVVRFANAWCPELLALARRLVTEGATEVWILVSKAVEVAPDVAPELIRIELDRQLQLIRMQPEGTRREAITKLMGRGASMWSYTVRKAAEKLPRPFAEQLFPWFASAIEKSSSRDDLYDSLASESFSTILREAVCEAAANDISYLTALVAKWQGSASHAIHRVLFEALQAALPSSAKLALKYLLTGVPVLGGVANLDGVFRTDDSLYTRRLIAALAPHLDQVECWLLEQHITNLDVHQTAQAAPEAKKWLYRANREHRYALLSALGADRVTSATRDQMEEDTRQFGEPSIAEPGDLSMHKIGSPMSAEEMLAASDEAILGLFQELPDTTEWSHPRSYSKGGSIQASRAFAEATLREPDRFARLLTRFQPGVTENPVCLALEPLASQLSLERVEVLIRQLMSCGFSSVAFRTAAASACSKVLQRQSQDIQLSPDLLEILEGWLSQGPEDAVTRAGEPEPEELDAASCTPLLFSSGGGGPLPDGNRTILDALTTAYLRGDPPQLEAWMQVLENHLERQDAPEVWRAMAWDLTHVLRAAPARAERFFSTLFARYPSVLHTAVGLRLVAQAMHTLPLTAVQRWMEDLRAGSWVRREQAFGELLALLATRHDATSWALDSAERALAQWQAASGSSAAEDRLILGLTIGVAELWDEPTRRGRASDLLLRLVPRASGAVAEAAMRAFSSTAPLLWDAATRQLLCALAGAPAVMLRGWYENLVGQLDQHLPADAALIKDVVTALVAELTRTSQYVLPDVGAALSRIALSLQRQPPPLREAGLELFEQLLDLGVSEARDLLKELDRLKSA